jgi:glycosyltransferase involved in cell wall biosynthesis
MKPIVSTIIPTYNRADLLARALDSVIAQDYRPLEAVVIDDGSTDHTPRIIEAYRQKLADKQVGFLFHRQQNGRAPKARNVGMKLATGPLLAFLDSDDLWLPHFVSTLVHLFDRYPSAGLAFCGIHVIDGHDRIWKTREMGIRGRTEGLLHRPFERILRHMPMQTSGVMVRRSVIDDIGDFDLDLPVVEDWDLWYRIAKESDLAYTLKCLACNRSHPDNLPKYDMVALASSVRLNTKHLPDVTDPQIRQLLIQRIERQCTLLQEELLREGKTGNGESHLLNELAPRTPRFALGSMISEGPDWVGRGYAWMIRALGELKRGTA